VNDLCCSPLAGLFANRLLAASQTQSTAGLARLAGSKLVVPTIAAEQSEKRVPRTTGAFPEGELVLETVIVLLVVLWAFGFWGPYHAHLGNFVHVLIVVAVVVLIIRLIQGRRLL